MKYNAPVCGAIALDVCKVSTFARGPPLGEADDMCIMTPYKKCLYPLTQPQTPAPDNPPPDPHLSENEHFNKTQETKAQNESSTCSLLRNEF